MNKGLLGCLIVGLVLLVVGGALSWFVVIKPMWDAGSEIYAAGQQWVQVAELDAKVSNTRAFTEPVDGRLNADQVQRFLAVQSAIEQGLGGNWKALEEKYDALKRGVEQENREPSLQEIFGAYGDLSGIVLTAKQAQVEALNKQGMSLAEYRYLRMQAYLAAGIALNDETPKEFAGSAAAHNAELMRPHKEMLERTLPTAWLGF
jgi:hypothetical protein